MLFPAPDGTLWLIYTAQISGNQDTAVVRCRDLARRRTHLGTDPRRCSRRAGRTASSSASRWSCSPMAWVCCRSSTATRCPARSGSATTTPAPCASRPTRAATWSEHPVPDSLGCVHMSIVADDRMALWSRFFRSRWADFVYAQRVHQRPELVRRRSRPSCPTTTPRSRRRCCPTAGSRWSSTRERARRHRAGVSASTTTSRTRRPRPRGRRQARPCAEPRTKDGLLGRAACADDAWRSPVTAVGPGRCGATWKTATATA